MNSVWAALTVLIVMIPTLARAAELVPSLAGSVLYESNVYRSIQDAEDDFLFRTTPNLRLREKRDKFGYDVYYYFPFERGIKTNTTFEIEHNLVGSFSAQLASTTDLSFRDSLHLSSTLREGRDEVDTGEGVVSEISNESYDVLQNSGSLSVRHRFGRQLTGTFTASHRLFDTDQPNRSNVQTVGANGRLNYLLNPRHQIGGGFGITRQAFDQRADLGASETFFYSANASWTYRISESLSFSVRAGPSFVTTEQDEADRLVSGVAAFPFAEADGETAYWVRLVPGDPSSVRGIVQAGTLVLDDFSSCSYIPEIQDPADQRVLGGGGCNVKVLVPTPDPNYDAILADASAPVDLEFAAGAEPASTSDSRFTLFGGVSVTQRWSPTLVSAFNYNRSESDASGLSGSTVLDSVSLTTSWRPRPRWTLAVRADWTQRKSLFPQTRTFQVVEPEDVTVGTDTWQVAKRVGLVARESDESVDTKRWGVGVRATRELFRNASARLNVQYNKQQSQSGTSGESSDFDNFIVELGFNYLFDPIQLW